MTWDSERPESSAIATGDRTADTTNRSRTVNNDNLKTRTTLDSERPKSSAYAYIYVFCCSLCFWYLFGFFMGFVVGADVVCLFLGF